MNGCVDVNIFFDIGAIGDHDAHGDAQREENLAHRVQKDLQQALQRQPFKIGGQVDGESLQAGARQTCIVCMF